MGLVVLAFLATLPQQAPPEPKPTFRRSLALVNRSDDALPAGVQVQVALGADASDVQVFHGGKRLAAWSRGPEVWFRMAEAIPGRGKDARYEVRYGGGKAASRPEEVFEFFEGFAAALDPKKWDWDPDLGFQTTPRGLEVTRIPGARSEHAPASLIPRFAPPPGFVLEVDMRWEIDAGVPASFALRAELTREGGTNAEARARAADLTKKLGGEEIAEREQAIRDLLKLGMDAVPSLEEAARGADPETRNRASLVLSRILETEAPPSIRTGLSTDAPPDARLDRVDLLGRSRTVLKRSYSRQGGDLLSIARAEDGETSLAWTRRRPVAVPGKIERIRIDFWSATGASAVMIRIVRVSVRRHVDSMPAAEAGPEEAIR